MQTLPQPSTLGTGGGTEYDDSSIRARPQYRWEGILGDPIVDSKAVTNKAEGRRFASKLAVWFGIQPTWIPGDSSHGLSLDVELVNGKYVLLESGTPTASAMSTKGKDADNDTI